MHTTPRRLSSCLCLSYTTRLPHALTCSYLFSLDRPGLNSSSPPTARPLQLQLALFASPGARLSLPPSNTPCSSSYASCTPTINTTTMHGSPAKQRAALAPLDANARPSLPSPKMPKDGSVSVIPLTGGSSPLKKSLSSSLTTTISGTKRPAEELTPPGRKKTCVEEVRVPPPPPFLPRHARMLNKRAQDARRSRTSSPDSPSLFDTSAAEGDSSWATAATEPDVAIVADAPALLAPRQRGTMTREQVREVRERALALPRHTSHNPAKDGELTRTLSSYLVRKRRFCACASASRATRSARGRPPCPWPTSSGNRCPGRRSACSHRRLGNTPTPLPLPLLASRAPRRLVRVVPCQRALRAAFSAWRGASHDASTFVLFRAFAWHGRRGRAGEYRPFAARLVSLFYFRAGQGRARVMGGKLHWTSWFRHWVGVRRIGTARDTT